MTNPVERERMSRELCESFGYVYQEGEWLGGIHEDEPVYPPLRDALIDARCRIGEYETILKALVPALESLELRGIIGDFAGIRGCIEQALREKEPKV